MIDRAVTLVRSGGNTFLRKAIAGDEALTDAELASVADPGLFGPTSVTWRVHASSAMLIGGLRALLLQTLHPLAMAGVAQHSDYRDDPWGRLHRTGRFVGATTYGSTETAEKAIATVRRVHTRVKGFAPDGRPYSANDPHLLLWVHVTEVDSFLRAYDRYGVGRLRDSERDRYVAEMSDVAERLGSERAPRSVVELADTLEGFRSECEANKQSHETVRFLLTPPVSLPLRPAYGVISAASVSLLPGWARRALWLPVPPLAEPFVVRPAAKALTTGIGWLMAARPVGASTVI